MQESVTEIQVNEMLQLADLDKDGKINYEGIVCVCQNKKKTNKHLVFPTRFHATHYIALRRVFTV